MINVVISLYYYLLILKAACLLEPEDRPTPLCISPPTKILTGALVFAMVAFGIYPTYLLDLDKAAAGALM